MTLDDESLLTAYLDGELAPDQRSSIEAALLADPELAEGLGRLAEVRELLAGMPRPTMPVDLAGTVVGRIRRHDGRHVRRARSGSPFPGRARLVAGLGLAAAVLIALTLALRGPRPVRAPGPPSPPPSLVVEARPGEPGPTEDARPPDPPAPRVAAATPEAGAAAGRPPVSEDEAKREREAERVREMLDSPRLRRIFIVTDVLGGTGRDRVEDLVRKTPRTEASYGRITVSQGIVIDPRHPNEATVYALVMNEQEQSNFRKRLEESFPRRVEDESVDPEVVTQLADIGQMAVLPGSTASAVVIPDDVSPQVALRAFPAPRAPQVEKNRISPEIDLARISEAGHLKINERPQVAEEKEGDAAGESAPEAAGDAPMLVRKEERPPSAGPGDEEGAAAPATEGSPKPRRFRDPPSIVLVWFTSP